MEEKYKKLKLIYLVPYIIIRNFVYCLMAFFMLFWYAMLNDIMELWKEG